jgi:hypothetical protein
MKSLIKNGITMLCLAVIIAVALPAHAKKDKDSDTDTQTIYQVLQHTDGSQALFAAILYSDSDDPDFGAGCIVKTGPLLDDKKKKLLFFAPSNRGFEKYFKIPEGEGGFDGMGAEAIVLAFPGLLHKLGLSNGAICDLLQRHLAPTKDAKKLTAKKLLQQGSITVEDGALLPIAIGDVGPIVDYFANITERDVKTVNGIIQYIDNVLVEPEPEDTDPPLPIDVCRELDCALQETECEQFVTACNLSMSDTEDCLQGAILICADINIGDGL